MWIGEAIHSTALSHPEDCACRVCRAASGNDPEAYADVVAALMLGGNLDRVEPLPDERNLTDGNN